MAGESLFSTDFKSTPYWWEAFRPADDAQGDVPASTSVAIIGGGYAGLATALELARHGTDCVVLEAQQLGFGASTRNGGGVSGALAISKGLKDKLKHALSDRTARMLAEADEAMTFLKDLIIKESMDCRWQENGRFVAAWTRGHFENQTRSVDLLNAIAHCGSHMVDRDRQREEIGSDFYFGGMVMQRSACLHPALYYKGLLEACIRMGAGVCSRTEVTSLRRIGTAWDVGTTRGTLRAEQVVVATNAYTGTLTPALRRRVVPIASHMIATEELPLEVAKRLIPHQRAVSDTRRVVCYFRMSPDGRRMLFGGRARFTDVGIEQSARILYGHMTARFPELRNYRVTHSWGGQVAFTLDNLPHMGTRDGMHFLLGCNGAGVAMMTYLGHQSALKILGRQERPCSFDAGDFPSSVFYRGRPWFLPIIGSWYQLLDNWDRRFA